MPEIEEEEKRVMRHWQEFEKTLYVIVDLQQTLTIHHFLSALDHLWALIQFFTAQSSLYENLRDVEQELLLLREDWNSIGGGVTRAFLNQRRKVDKHFRAVQLDFPDALQKKKQLPSS